MKKKEYRENSLNFKTVRSKLSRCTVLNETENNSIDCSVSNGISGQPLDTLNLWADQMYHLRKESTAFFCPAENCPSGQPA